MKSVFNKFEKKKSEDIVFPVLAEALVGRETFVVLFLSKNRGVIVKGNDRNHTGSFKNNYISVTSKTRWRILSPEESIVLSND